MLAARRLIPRGGPAARWGPAAPLPRRAPASPQRPARARGGSRGLGPATCKPQEPRGRPGAPASAPPPPPLLGPGPAGISLPGGSAAARRGCQRLRGRGAGSGGRAAAALRAAACAAPPPSPPLFVFIRCGRAVGGRGGGREASGCPRQHFPHAAVVAPR